MYNYLEEELDQLRTRIIKMSSLVEEQIEFAFRGLFEANLELANLVKERDDKVDKFDVKIDKHCQRIFALTQPVAVDLRLIMSALKINNDLERMGDIAVNIAERIEPLMNNIDLLKKVKIDDMSTLVQTIVKSSIDSFVNNDPELALEIIKLDNKVDDMDHQIFDLLINIMENDKTLIRPCSHAITLLRNIERLSDHATNIAEDVYFLTDAKIIKHRKDIEEIDTKQ
ncbi:MAG TPA: phosphate transport system regulatory protein PhoU [Bacteroidetes bacterium]|nr:phosphate signaling complex protein PhoU [Ignavibacteria bacterium]HCA43256.1 phosphate transport system regulatory protein PhoU [Bacteroidota bacterium]HCN38566.1 phosphate transport system regulatory protein PhoU [Bacteroidota bacterium]